VAILQGGNVGRYGGSVWRSQLWLFGLFPRCEWV
jgi:hypothetical protein